MRKSLAGAVGAAAAVLVFANPGSAGAINEWVGQPYGKVLEQVQSWGGTLVIATREGSYLPTDECVVVGSRKSGSLDSSGRARGYATYLVDLNCNATTAASGHPGNSSATPAGKKASERIQRAKFFSADYEKKVAAGETPACLLDAKRAEWCVNLCIETKACSAELSEALGL